MLQFVNSEQVDCRATGCVRTSDLHVLVQLSLSCCLGRSEHSEFILQAKRRTAIGCPRLTGTPQFEPATAPAKSSETKTFSLPSPVPFNSGDNGKREVD